MVEIPQFDSLAQGLGYAKVPSPNTDALPTGGIGETQHIQGSTNDPMYTTPVSEATRNENAPLTGSFLPSNLHDDNWLNPEKPIF